jgi:hypothetical protein
LLDRSVSLTAYVRKEQPVVYHQHKQPVVNPFFALNHVFSLEMDDNCNAVNLTASESMSDEYLSSHFARQLNANNVPCHPDLYYEIAYYKITVTSEETSLYFEH